jgi:hypothetical protein
VVNDDVDVPVEIDVDRFGSVVASCQKTCVVLSFEMGVCNLDAALINFLLSINFNDDKLFL